MRFFNSTQKNMSFSDVIASIRYFIKLNPDSGFRLAVGTDSQGKGNSTCFATAVHIHRVGQGAWCCVTKHVENKRYEHPSERIARETLFTFEMTNMLYEHLIDGLTGFSAKYENFDFKLEAHMDMGENGETRKLIREMTSYFEGSGSDVRLKPEAFAAGSLAGGHHMRVRAG